MNDETCEGSERLIASPINYTLPQNLIESGSRVVSFAL